MIDPISFVNGWQLTRFQNDKPHDWYSDDDTPLPIVAVAFSRHRRRPFHHSITNFLSRISRQQIEQMSKYRAENVTIRSDWLTMNAFTYCDAKMANRGQLDKDISPADLWIPFRAGMRRQQIVSWRNRRANRMIMLLSNAQPSLRHTGWSHWVKRFFHFPDFPFPWLDATTYRVHGGKFARESLNYKRTYTCNLDKF